ncbi:hypothetical protein A7U60_g5110 [Sanghuangporus baumii]|uniref:Uncharacterized protein n=1 Tax=Sanghuangporus baumii TaxID=108892 RepID=A0A9Q5HXZ4_SANBA|nr:hypothetical protein A7U60_g5110 [Sanghuangporus baumii]
MGGTPYTPCSSPMQRVKKHDFLSPLYAFQANEVHMWSLYGYMGATTPHQYNELISSSHDLCEDVKSHPNRRLSHL